MCPCHQVNVHLVRWWWNWLSCRQYSKVSLSGPGNPEEVIMTRPPSWGGDGDRRSDCTWNCSQRGPSIIGFHRSVSDVAWGRLGLRRNNHNRNIVSLSSGQMLYFWSNGDRKGLFSEKTSGFTLFSILFFKSSLTIKLRISLKLQSVISS